MNSRPALCAGRFQELRINSETYLLPNTAVVEARLADHFRDPSGHPGYAKALALFTLVIFLVLILLAAIGREEGGKEF